MLTSKLKTRYTDKAYITIWVYRRNLVADLLAGGVSDVSLLAVS
jgi:hypothetical protein